MANGKEKEVYLTAAGLQKLKEELEYLIRERRPEVARQIHDAKMDGDISENAGYDEAKAAQAFLEGRIMELEWKISHAVIIEDNNSTDQVGLGNTVTLKDTESGEEEQYTIVGSAEADPSNGRISNESPIGKALMKRKLDEEVVVTTPGGEITFVITKIE